MSLDIEHLRRWIGRTEAVEDIATLAPLRGLAATLDRDDPPPRAGDAIPPGWHWLYFLPMQRQAAIGPDGHPQRGGFLPPVPLPRRMWAGSRIEFHAPLRAGQAISRLSHIEDVQSKQGRSGPLVFVRLRHEISAEGALALVEQQDLVYREMARPGEPAPGAEAAAGKPQWSRGIEPDAVLLFRYSALTFNGHRIHYDRTYATKTEGYAGLVVHGPLIATLLLDLLRRHQPQASLARFDFRAVSPLLDTAAFRVCARQTSDKTIHLWAEGIDGRLAMDANATLA
ncbi:MaoC family dehydratase N-terminal domain-containing protein [Pelomonas sp. KK5]|uniref:FAS1-like dehydratase domain-containing protein n=1 Tax=Pelomonas sp. KK5 TaxID=1855730 RepID=UPI00097C48FB|nr:MaoC family dehydratase N-terminal domain-containing protein [Pelomonas sp. KK5]